MSARSEAVVRSLGLLFEQGTHCGLTDAELLERFLSRPDDAAAHAFEGLVLRHGPMVFEVCNKVLDNPHDAQDAFQATFLVLATRRGRSIGKPRSGAGCTAWPCASPTGPGPTPRGGRPTNAGSPR